MTLDLVSSKIVQVKEILCCLFDERSFELSDEEIQDDGNIEEIINTHLDDIQELYIELLTKVEES